MTKYTAIVECSKLPDVATLMLVVFEADSKEQSVLEEAAKDAFASVHPELAGYEDIFLVISILENKE